MWNTGGMILTGENRTAGRKTCRSTNLSTTNLTWTGIGLNPVLRGVGQGTVLAGGGGRMWWELFGYCRNGRVYLPIFVMIMKEIRKLRKWKVIARVRIGLSGSG